MPLASAVRGPEGWASSDYNYPPSPTPERPVPPPAAHFFSPKFSVVTSRRKPQQASRVGFFDSHLPGLWRGPMRATSDCAVKPVVLNGPLGTWENSGGDELRQDVPEMKKGAGASPLLLN